MVLRSTALLGGKGYFVYWLNVDYVTGICKLHEDTCRYCTPKKTAMKNVGKMGEKGGWVSFEKPDQAKKYYDSEEPDKIWQPCKVCTPC